MSRVLLDQNVPIGLRGALAGHDVVTARHLGWHELRNGELIAAAEAAQFDVLVTCDQGIRHQQNLRGRRLALVVLGTNDWPRVQSALASIALAVETATAGDVVEVLRERPPARR